ncbi:hypothetical protein P879_04192 [Paragonimus westermani]|uniref:RRM domain-containing protein n=1 Tax=Paragonimus westermani TaxID=34504 RepID=A0A8T0DEB9_9TREM|nr:hypothetical protein P879_04192 [Paragonimus westermani]
MVFSIIRRCIPSIFLGTVDLFRFNLRIGQFSLFRSVQFVSVMLSVLANWIYVAYLKTECTMLVRDEAEEGEVNDGSDAEEGDSDPNYVGDSSPRHPRTGLPRAGAAELKTKLQLGVAGILNNVENSTLSYYVTNTSENGTFYSPRVGRSMSYSSANVSATFEPAEFNNAVSTFQDEVQENRPALSRSTQTGTALPYLPPSRGPAPQPLPQLPLLNGPPAPFVGARLPTPPTLWAPPAPPASAAGSQQEIELMHQMYQKACQLYERAIAKVGATGANLPLVAPPRPPPIPFVSPSSGGVPSNRPLMLPNLTDSLGAQYVAACSVGVLPEPPNNDSRVQAQIPPKKIDPSIPPSCVDPQPTITNGSLSSLTSQSNYHAAYACAYKQTVEAIPTPANGGPAPDSLAYRTLWQRYMDYYLRYYLQAYAARTSAAVSAASLPSSTTAPVTSSSCGPLSTTPTATLLITPTPSELPKHTDAVGEPTSPSVKRSRPAEPSTMCELGSKVSEHPRDRTPNGSRQQSEHKSTEQVVPVSDSSTTTLPSTTDDMKSSKCIWISNLPQGVKAVDVKERCTPFGRVQTIKIIGSRKSTPPSIYAYLVMETPDAALRLVEGLQGASFRNQEIKVKRINALPIP